MNEIREITSPDVPAPLRGMYSNAVACGDVVYVSGMHAGSPEGIVGDTMYEQAREALRRIVALVEAAGGSADRITRLTIYVTDISLRAEVGRARSEVFSAPLPAATLLEVSGFVVPDLLVEIEATAHL